MVTRFVAILPAIAVTLIYGDSGTARLLVLSQVVLSLQLPFAIIPLIMFTADPVKMRGLATPKWLSWTCWLISLVVISLNLKLIFDVVSGNVAI